MSIRFLKIADGLHRPLQVLCLVLLCIFFLAMLAGVLLRYGFSAGSVIIQDIQGYSVAVLVVLAIAVSQHAGKHVRAELLDETKAGTRFLKIRDLAELVFAVVPLSVVLVLALSDVWISWNFLEGSTEPEGLGGYYLVRTALPVMCFFMILFCFSRFLQQQR